MKLFICVLLVTIAVDSGLSDSPNDPAPARSTNRRPQPSYSASQPGAPNKPYSQDLAKQGRCHHLQCCARFVFVGRVYNWPTSEWCYLCPPIFNSYCTQENALCNWCRWGDWWCMYGRCKTTYWSSYHQAWCWNRWQTRWIRRRIRLRRVNCVCTPTNWYTARQATRHRPSQPRRPGGSQTGGGPPPPPGGIPPPGGVPPPF